MPTIIKNRPILYPLSGKDLEEGQIYEGSNDYLYVGVGLLHLVDGTKLSAVGAGNDYLYVGVGLLHLADVTKLSAVGAGNDYFAYENLGDDAIFFPRH